MIQEDIKRYLAAIGSKKVRLDLLAEMLDEPKQLKNFRARLKDGRDVPDENGARSAIVTTLKAVVSWHKKLDVRHALRDNTQDLDRVYGAMRKLAEKSPSIVLRNDAKRALQAIDQGS